MNPARFSVCAGSVLGLSGVVLGAWGAHGLASFVGHSDLGAWETAVEYQLVHAVVLLVCGVLAHLSESRAFRVAAALLLVGVLLFSGSIYLLMLGGPGWLGPITPIGGVLLISGWVALLVGAVGWQ